MKTVHMILCFRKIIQITNSWFAVKYGLNNWYGQPLGKRCKMAKSVRSLTITMGGTFSQIQLKSYMRIPYHVWNLAISLRNATSTEISFVNNIHFSCKIVVWDGFRRNVFYCKSLRVLFLTFGGEFYFSSSYYYWKIILSICLCKKYKPTTN